MVLASLSDLLGYIGDSISTIIQFIDFIGKLPSLILNLFNSFPGFIRIGMSVIFSMLVVAMIVRIISYVK